MVLATQINKEVGHITFQWVSVDLLRVDDTYQRALSKKRVALIAKAWEIEKVGTIIVSMRVPNVYYVLDGQHRVSAARIRNIESLPCLILHGLTQAKEALLRMAYNQQKRDTAIELFKLRLAAQDTDALAIKSAVEFCGLSLYLGAKGGGSLGTISCVGALDYIYTHCGGVEGLKAVLDIATLAWPDDTSARSTFVLRGIGAFWRKYNTMVDHLAVAEKLSKRPCKSILNEAKQRQKDIYGAGHLSTHFAHAILRELNKKVKVNRLPMLFES